MRQAAVWGEGVGCADAGGGRCGAGRGGAGGELSAGASGGFGESGGGAAGGVSAACCWTRKGKREMRGSLHCATDDETVRRFGRDDGFWGCDGWRFR